MSDSPISPEPPVVIPESLRRQLEDFRRDLWRVKVLEAVIAGVIGLLVSFLLVYGLDRVWTTPGWVRLAILAGGTSLFAVFAPLWLHRWVWRHRREAQLARLIARRYPGLGDRLLGVIELQSQSGPGDTLSPRLRAAAMEAVAAETGRRRLREALPAPRHRRWALVALVLGAAAAMALMVTPRAGRNALQRWLMPLSDTERYTFTILENPPLYLAVPYGEAFEVELRLAEDSERRPESGRGRYGLQPEVGAKREGEVYRFAFPGQQAPGTVVFRIGDARHLLKVEPVQRPAVTGISARLTPPAYLEIPAETVDPGNGVIQAVEGSTIRFELETSRPLAKGRFGPTVGLGAEEGAGREFVSKEGELSLSGSRAVAPELEVGAESFEVPFIWEDALGIAGDGGFKLRVEARRDAAPNAYLQGVDRQKVMLPEETLDFEVLAEDDFGIRSAGLEWKGEFTKPTGESPARGGMLLEQGASSQRRLSKAASFSPAAFGIPPQKIALRAYVEDYFPGRGRVYSEPVILYVLSRDEHAQLLKSRFDRAITGLEDLARRELSAYEENQRLKRLDGERLQSEENRKRLELQEQMEAENTRRMEELARTMEQLFQDATRNGEVDKETLRKMAESLKSMQELSAEDMPKVREKLGDAKDPSNTAEKTEEDLSEAVEEQRKVVDKMREAIERAGDANRRLEAGTFVNRLKKAASEQEGIARSLIGVFSRLLGTRRGELDPADLRHLADSGRQQMETASDVRWIQEDLRSYFARTDEAVFREIYEEMRGSRIDMGLEEVRNRLASNHSFMATEGSKQWAAKLSEWAAKLEEEMKNGQQGGDGGGSQSPSPEDEDFEFMLRVMKMIQQQQDLRARTRALEQLRRSVENGGAFLPES